MSWKKYKDHLLKHKPFYQKKIKGIYVEIICYNEKYEVNIQIPEEKSITQKTINIIIFTYFDLDFKKKEKDVLSIIDKLTI